MQRAPNRACVRTCMHAHAPCVCTCLCGGSARTAGSRWIAVARWPPSKCVAGRVSIRKKRPGREAGQDQDEHEDAEEEEEEEEAVEDARSWWASDDAHKDSLAEDELSDEKTASSSEPGASFCC